MPFFEAVLVRIAEPGTSESYFMFSQRDSPMPVMVLAVWTSVRLPREGWLLLEAGGPNAEEQVDSASDDKSQNDFSGSGTECSYKLTIIVAVAYVASNHGPRTHREPSASHLSRPVSIKAFRVKKSKFC
jgi:hypothetical protein